MGQNKEDKGAEGEREKGKRRGEGKEKRGEAEEKEAGKRGRIR